MPEDLLVPLDKYLAAGVHIGTQQKEATMRSFIYNIRPDGLAVFNVQVIDQRIRAAAKLLSKFTPGDILVVSARDNAKTAVDMFAEMIGSKVLSKRFMPGTLTNPDYPLYMEPSAMFITDTALDYRAIKEASSVGMPVVALCDTNNMTKMVDLVVPGNNKGKKSVALILWLLARETLRARGTLPKDEAMKHSAEEMQGQ